MPRTEIQKELFEAAKHFAEVAKAIRDTGIVEPKTVADIGDALAFLFASTAWHHDTD